MFEMFKSKKIESITIIGIDSKFEGNIESEETVFVQGKVKAKTIKAKNLVIYASGEVTGDIVCDVLSVSGYLKGNVVANAVSIENTASVQSKISYADSISIDKNAIFNGSANKTSSSNLPTEE